MDTQIAVLADNTTIADFPISQHYKLSDFTRSETAHVHGVDNTPTPDVIANLHVLAAFAERCNAVLSMKSGKQCVIRFTSGFRCYLLNKAVGGVNGSKHETGEAFDGVCPEFGTPLDMARALSTPFEFEVKDGEDSHTESDTLDFDQIIYEGIHGIRWCHVGVSATHPDRRMVLWIDVNGTHPGLPGHE